MTYSYDPGFTTSIKEVTIGATKEDGGSRSVSYRIGGDFGLPAVGKGSKRPLIAYEICDDLSLWPEVAVRAARDASDDPSAWASYGSTLGVDLIKLSLTSTHRRGYIPSDQINYTVNSVLTGTTLPIIIEGSMDPDLDSEVFQRCGEAGEGERLVLGTAEAGRYRSIAAAAIAYSHVVIAQSPIDVNLAKQLNILLRETGLPNDRIIIDPYTGALGYGFEYSYSTMERIRYAALKGDTDLAMPIISAPSDTLTIKEVREAEDADAMAVSWEYNTSIASALAGAAILVVRHPTTIKPLKKALDAIWGQFQNGGI